MQDPYLDLKIEKLGLKTHFENSLEGTPWMEESSCMDTIPQIKEIPMIFYGETITNNTRRTSWRLASMQTWKRILSDMGFVF